MAFTFGFYNSLNGDRKYNAEQISAIFDGLISNGVYDTIGQLFAVKPGTGMQVTVGTGRAWFDHTWNDNDSVLPLFVDAADITLARYDTVVLEVNAGINVRTNTIKIVKGTAGTNPVKPTLTNSGSIHQHALAHIRIPGGATSITASMIQNVVGTSECPFVTGIIQTAQIDALFQQWEGEFDEWFENVQATLTDNVVTNLQLQIDQRVKIADKATTAEAQAGTNDTKWLTPAKANVLITSKKYKVGDIVTSGRNFEVDEPGFVPCDGRTLNRSSFPALMSTDMSFKIPANIIKKGTFNGGNLSPWGICSNDYYYIMIFGNAFYYTLKNSSTTVSTMFATSGVGLFSGYGIIKAHNSLYITYFTSNGYIKVLKIPNSSTFTSKEIFSIGVGSPANARYEGYAIVNNTVHVCMSYTYSNKRYTYIININSDETTSQSNSVSSITDANKTNFLYRFMFFDGNLYSPMSKTYIRYDNLSGSAISISNSHVKNFVTSVSNNINNFYTLGENENGILYTSVDGFYGIQKIFELKYNGSSYEYKEHTVLKTTPLNIRNSGSYYIPDIYTPIGYILRYIGDDIYIFDMFPLYDSTDNSPHSFYVDCHLFKKGNIIADGNNRKITQSMTITNYKYITMSPMNLFGTSNYGSVQNSMGCLLATYYFQDTSSTNLFYNYPFIVDFDITKICIPNDYSIFGVANHAKTTSYENRYIKIT